MNVPHPAISIVMPLYNKEREVARAIASVLAQTFGDFELVVVDDGSTDGGPAVVAACNDPRIRMIRQENAGASAARNQGIREAQTGLVAFLDADDVWLPHFLETVLRLRAKFPCCKVFATSYFMRDASGAVRPASLQGLPAAGWEGTIEDYFTLASISDPPLCSSAVAVEKTALEAVGCFPVGISSGEDLLTWARLADRYPIAYSTHHGAVFWMPEDVSARPGRFAANKEDIVGRELAKILATASPEHAPGLQKYLGRWHEMRAIIALQRNRHHECLQEVRQAYRYAHSPGKLTVIFLLACLPGTLPGRAYLWLKKARTTLQFSGGTVNGTP